MSGQTVRTGESLHRETAVNQITCRVCASEEDLLTAQRIRYQVYCLEKGWIPPDACPDGLEWDKDDAQAVHFLATQNGRALGTSRLLVGGRQMLPGYNFIDVESLGLSPADVVEVSRVAVLRHGRSSDGRAFLALTRSMWQWSAVRSHAAWIAVTDEALFHRLEGLKMPFLHIGEPVWYLGSLCVPVAVDIPGTIASLGGMGVSDQGGQT
jgi:N-acyl-L-homoserine lactone synthetase